MSSATTAHLALRALSAGVVIAAAGPAMALQVADIASWSSPTAGTIGSTSITVTGLSNVTVSDFTDFTDSNFNPSLTGPNSIEYAAKSDWSASFSTPVTNLGLYMGFWRGVASGADPTTYTFDQTPVLISGCSNGTVSGNTLTIASTGFCSGILQFSGPISSLTVDTNASADSVQLFTMATFTDSGPGPTPVPGPLPLFGAGAAFAWSRKLRRRISAGSCRI